MPEHGKIKSTDKESKLRVKYGKNKQETGDYKRAWSFFGCYARLFFGVLWDIIMIRNTASSEWKIRFLIDKNCFPDLKYKLSLTEYLSSTSVPLTFLLHFKQVSLKINTLLKASFTVETIKKEIRKFFLKF